MINSDNHGTEVTIRYATDQIKIACTYLVEESHGLCQKSAVRVNIIGQPLSHENMNTHFA